MIKSWFLALMTQMALVSVRLLGHLGVHRARALTRWIGPWMARWMTMRRSVVDQNLAWCFPHRSDEERLALRHRHFEHLGEAIGETAVAWVERGRLGIDTGVVEGIEHVHAVQATGRGVLLLTGHCVCLEWATRLSGEAIKMAITYRPLSNPTLERFQNQARGRIVDRRFDRDDVRGMVRYLKAGGVVWYAPDQDFGPSRSLCVPFFGLETATLRALPRLVELGGAVVCPMYPIKDEATGRVTVHIEAPWWDYPTGDMAQDLRRYNAFLERYIDQAPAQYWWVHRRFKTAPDGVRAYARA